MMGGGGGITGRKGWNSSEGKRFPVWATGVGKGRVGMQGSTVMVEKWWDRSSVDSSSVGEGRWRTWGVLVLQFFFLIVPSCCSFILDVYLLGEVDAFTPIPLIFSFVPHLRFVSSTFPWT